MIIYSYNYQHSTKEVIVTFQVGSSPSVKLIMGAEAFTQDLDFIRNDQKLAHFISVVKERKDLPINHDFGANAEIKFNPEEWEGRMKESI